MKRFALALQIALAVVLTALWLRWNPLSPDCAGDGSNCTEGDQSNEADVFADALPEPLPPSPDLIDEAYFEVEYDGCTAMVMPRRGEIECIYRADSELRVWVVHPRVDEVELTLDGQLWQPTRYSVRNEPGRGFRGMLAGDDLGQLAIRAPGEDPWTLRLRASTRLTADEQAVQARRRDQSARLENMAIDDEPGVVASTLELIEELLERGFLNDAVDIGLGVSFQLTWRAGRLDLAEQVLDSIAPHAELYPQGRAFLAVYRGHVLMEQGRFVEAARAYRRGGRFGVRMDDVPLQRDALSIYAALISELGYFEAASYWASHALVRAREEDAKPHALASMLSMSAWINLQLRKAGQAYQDPEPMFRELIEISSKLGSHHRTEGYLGLAELALLDNDYDSALDHLDHLDHLDMDTLHHGELVEARDLRLQALLTSKASSEDIRVALEQLKKAALWEAAPSARWLAALRRGEILEQEGRLADTREAYEEAEDLLDRVIPLALLGVQGEVNPARRRDGTQRLVSVLLRQGQSAQALCVLRQAQARVGMLSRLFPRLDPQARQPLYTRVEAYLRAKREYEALLGSAEELPRTERQQARREAARRHEELHRYALEILATQANYRGRPSCDELTSRGGGEMLLGIYPHGDELLVIVQDDEGTTHRLLSAHENLTRSDNAEWFGSVLLDPLDERLDRASRIRVLASGAAAAIDIHALPWRERPLVEQRPVVYGLDLPPLGSPERPEHSGHALILADMLAAGTKREARRVETALRNAEWSVERWGSDKRSAHDVRAQLAYVDHFHYAGHAYYSVGGSIRRSGQRAASDDMILRLWPPYPGGAAAEPSYIKLGRSGRLDVQDILMMKDVPRSVVLMGCATGVNDERMAYGGFSLATAFLGAGAEVVVASTREVDGREASLLGQGLYTDLDDHGVDDPGEWFMSAVRWARHNGLPAQAIRDYRVYVP
ncbi:MAG: CHAT domain-containing protein [Myxococcota bacterium]